MGLTFANIEKAIKELGPPPSPQSPIYVSKHMMDVLMEIVGVKTTNIFWRGIKFIESPLLPYESTWEACDIATKQEIKVAGEQIHLIMIPAIHPDGIWGTFFEEQYENDQREFLKNTFDLFSRNIFRT